jgi:hypothetical protein
MATRWARLAAALLLVGLLASRLSLVLHELIGHGGVATLLGGEISAYHLFLFGGGWISYEWGAEHGLAASLAVSLGGIVVPVLVAAVALLAARRVRVPIARLALVGLATADLLHAGFYLAVGTHHGFGDGRLLHAELGAAAPALVWAMVLATAIAGFLLARRLARLAGDWTGASSRRGRAAALIAAALVAGAVHGGLTLAERLVTRDETYGRIMKPEAERRVDRELARLARAARGRGAPLDPAELEAIRAQLARREGRELPLAPILIGILVVACGAGTWRGVARRAEPEVREAPSWRDLVPLGAATAAALGLVAVLRALE